MSTPAIVIPVAELPPLAELVRKNRGLIFKVAQKTHGRLVSAGVHLMSFDDFQQEATVVMQRCAEKFDASRGFKFSTYFVRSALNDLNRIVDKLIREHVSLGVFSMSAPVNDDGDSLDFESIIDAGYGDPVDIIEAQETAELFENLSPLARTLAEMMADTPAAIDREWDAMREQHRQSRVLATGNEAAVTNMPKEVRVSFIAEWLRAASHATASEMSAAVDEVEALRKAVYG